MKSEMFKKEQEAMENKISKFIIDNRAKIAKDIFSALLIIVCTIVLGAWNWVEFGFSLDVIKTSQYWIHVAVRSVCLICMYQLGINLFFDRTREKSKALNEAVNTYDELIKLKDTDFPEYVERELNRNVIKKEAYRKSQIRKIQKLDRRATPEERLLFVSDENMTIEKKRWFRTVVENKETNKYCRKKSAIMKLLEDENLEKIIDSANVKCQYVEAAVFDLDIHGNVVVDSYKVKSNQASATAKGISAALVMMIPMGMLASSLIPGLMEEGQILTSIINCVLDVAFCLWQLIRGIMFCEKLLNTEYLLPYSNRIRILKMYINWSKGRETSSAGKILKYLENKD